MFPTFTVWGIKFYSFPFVILLALFASVIVYLLAPKYNRIYQITVLRMFPPILLSAAVGARMVSAITLSSVSEYSFWHNLMFGGAVFYGGVLGGLIALPLVCRRKQLDFLAVTDLLATILPLGHAIGRFGCYMNGCCYGRQYSGMFAVDYVIDGVATTVFPTWFFEAGFCALLFIYFQFIHRNNSIGRRTAIYFIAYSAYRFLIEFLRGDEIRGHLSSWSSSQVISVFMLIFGLSVLFANLKNNKENYLFYKESYNYAA